MRLLPVLAILLGAGLVLSGCSDSPKGGATTSSSSSSSTSKSTSTTSSSSATTTSSSSSTSTAPPTNHPPTGQVSVVVNGTSATFSLDGNDADGDGLNWSLAFGDGQATNGAALPASANHTYAAAGNFTAVFAVSDGQAESSYNVTIGVVSGGGPSITLSGHLAGPDPSAAAGQGCFYAALHILPFVPFPNDLGALFEVPSEAWGWTYQFDIPDMEADFIDAAGNVLETGGSGAVPTGATQVLVCGAGPSTVDVDYALILKPG